MSSRTTGTSPFQPRSPPVYSNAVDRRGRPSTSHGEVGDLGDRDVVPGRDVEDREAARARSRGREHGGDDVARHGCRTCSAVPSPRIRSRVGSSSSRRTKSKPTPWVWRGPTTLPNRKQRAAQAEHVARTSDEQRLAGQLARAVGGDGHHRAVVLVRLELAEVAVDAAAGRVEDAARRRPAHRLDDVVGEQRALVEVDRRARLRRAAMSGLEARWIDRVVAGDRRGQRVEVA